MSAAASGVAPVTPRLFRGLVVASLLVGVSAAALDALWPSLLPGALADAAEAVQSTANDSFASIAVLAAVFLAALVGTYGLFMFQRWGRSLSLWVTVITLPLLAVQGPVVLSGWASALVDLSSSLWAAALAVAYWSPLAGRFERG